MVGTTFDAPQRHDDACFFDSNALRAWSLAFLPGKGWNHPLTVLGVRAPDKTARGFTAFATQSFAGFRVASLAGYYWPFRTLAIDPDDPAFPASAEALAESLARSSPASVLRMGPVSADDRAVRGLVVGLLSRGWGGLRRESGAVFELRLPADADQLERCVSPSLLRNIAYLRRRLGRQHGEVRVDRHVLGVDSAVTLAALERIEAASWVAGSDSKFIGEANRRYWTALGRAVAKSWNVVLWTLHTGDRPLAFSAHFETPNVVYILANSFDGGWKAHSPGSILTLEVLRDAVVRGRQRVDWGQGDSGYKARWGAKPAAALCEVMLFRPGLVGSMLHAAARLKLRDWKVVDRD